MSKQPSSRPAMVEAISAGMAELQARVRTVVPCVVVSYNAATQSAAVQPAPTNRRTQGDPEPLTQVPNAPVVFPAGGGWAISWPLAPGDPVLVLCSDRGIDRWRASGSPYTPADRRMHRLTDAFVWPGGGPAPDTDGTPSPVNLRIEGPGGVALEVTPAGTITLAGQGVPAAVARVGDAVTSSALLTLQDAFNAWVPAPNDGGAALQAALSPFLNLTEAEVQGGVIASGSALVSSG